MLAILIITIIIPIIFNVDEPKEWMGHRGKPAAPTPIPTRFGALPMHSLHLCASQEAGPKQAAALFAGCDFKAEGTMPPLPFLFPVYIFSEDQGREVFP